MPAPPSSPVALAGRHRRLEPRHRPPSQTPRSSALLCPIPLDREGGRPNDAAPCSASTSGRRMPPPTPASPERSLACLLRLRRHRRLRPPPKPPLPRSQRITTPRPTPLLPSTTTELT
uniref:Uncharacterized protein n=1 Tax=Triticum urartu TaxID=4572 RepID=A0A8R7U1Y7_TRIUA